MKKYLWMLSVFSLLGVFLLVLDTYGLFETAATGIGNFPLAKWKIVLNKEELVDTKEITLSDFTFKENTHIEDGFFAPGSEAFYEFEIDASGTDVSVSYEIQIDASALKDHPNIILTVTDQDHTANVSDDGLIYTGVLPKETLNELKKFTIDLVWQNDPLFDDQDTDLINKELPIKLKVSFSQYTGG